MTDKFNLEEEEEESANKTLTNKSDLGLPKQAANSVGMHDS